MKLYSYVLRYDTGFAPNPYWGFCTLACCKPKIRKAAEKGDWIIGISPKAAENKIIYAMKVKEKMDFASYYYDQRFQKKIPKMNGLIPEERLGDNIYEPLVTRCFRQLPSMHSNIDGSENCETKCKDLSGKYVLISKDFYYFGSKPIEISTDLMEIIKVARPHKILKDEAIINKIIEEIQKNPSDIPTFNSISAQHCGNNSKKCCA